MHQIIKFLILHIKTTIRETYFPDWRGVYQSEHLPGILCTSRNMFSGYIPTCGTKKHCTATQILLCGGVVSSWDIWAFRFSKVGKSVIGWRSGKSFWDWWIAVAEGFSAFQRLSCQHVYIAFDVEFSSINMTGHPWKIGKICLFWWLTYWSWHHNAGARELLANHTLLYITMQVHVNS